jgi:hypothetical protein
MFEPQKELNDFFQQLYTNEIKKTVLLARANGETLEEVGRKLGVTRELVRRVEAKITRKFAMSHSGRKIREDLIALCASGAVQSPEDLNVYFGEHGAELAYLLRLYKASFFYSGDLQIDLATMIKLDEEN